VYPVCHTAATHARSAVHLCTMPKVKSNRELGGQDRGCRAAIPPNLMCCTTQQNLAIVRCCHRRIAREYRVSIDASSNLATFHWPLADESEQQITPSLSSAEAAHPLKLSSVSGMSAPPRQSMSVNRSRAVHEASSAATTPLRAAAAPAVTVTHKRGEESRSRGGSWSRGRNRFTSR
jgi:hypothetical protein